MKTNGTTPNGGSCNNRKPKSASVMYSEVTKQVWIGGPETSLPRFVESFLAWSLAISLLSVSGYHFVRQTILVPFMTMASQFCSSLLASAAAVATSTAAAATMTPKSKSTSPSLPCWLPLTTASRNEINSKSCEERYEQLTAMLGKQALQNDADLVSAIRSSSALRRLATLAMHPSGACATKPLGARLIRNWHRLLQLPDDDATSYAYDISVILPAYKEDGRQIVEKIQRLYERCTKPQRVQLIFVIAGACHNLDQLHGLRDACPHWGDVRITMHEDGGGRGPCLNFGAKQGTGRVLAFCHSDTVLPDRWDDALMRGIRASPEDVPNSCAYGFGIDTSQVGLNGGIYPPGIKAVEVTANIRTHLYSLPYGDQCLSVPSHVFHYVGGFPDQCLMEDYELISLLRRRVALLGKFGLPKERLVILDGPSALCSPRRWQKFGVLFVTWTNSKCVNLYTGGMTPDDLFRVYYGRSPPQRKQPKMEWEMEVEKALAQSNGTQ